MSIMSEAVTISKDDMTCKNRCQWENLLTDHMRMTVQQVNFETGFFTLLLGIWLNSTILMSEKLQSEKCYRNLLNYTIAATLRRAVPVIVMLTLPFRTVINCICQNLVICQFFGVLDSVIAVFELESLAQVCIERFINALYAYKGWYNPVWHNKLFIVISLLLALVYSLLPMLLGYGSYKKDFDCVNCTFDFWLPQTNAYKMIIIMFLILKNIKPVLVMVFSLSYTRWMELKKIADDKNSIVFSFSMCIIVMVNIICWFPIFLVRSSVIITQLLYQDSELIWSPCFVMWAIFLHWVSPLFAMIGFIWYNQRVRAKMLNLMTLRPIDSDETAPPIPVQPDSIQPVQEPKAQETKPQENKAQDTN